MQTRRTQTKRRHISAIFTFIPPYWHIFDHDKSTLPHPETIPSHSPTHRYIRLPAHPPPGQTWTNTSLPHSPPIAHMAPSRHTLPLTSLLSFTTMSSNTNTNTFTFFQAFFPPHILPSTHCNVPHCHQPPPHSTNIPPLHPP